ncbi:hypothetical protein C6497_16560 [Candidatus Poribacteria bacterium]|nr:MAG: hypothetical protein C6497_16560 [Candidatus Poribacteria bacterium]
MNTLQHIINGFLIGIANIIPGMSGGTLALVLGIYERLINALRNIGINTAKSTLGLLTFKQEAFSSFRDELRNIDFKFLFLLGVGAFISVVFSSKIIVYLLSSHHDATYGFFFGLVLTSIIIPIRMLNGFRWKELFVLLLAIGLIVTIEEMKKSAANSVSVSGDDFDTSIATYGLFFISGALAISAMILPGISGSFLMLAFGVYFPLITAIKDTIDGFFSLLKGGIIQPILDNILILGVFAIGCLGGLLLFTRLLNLLLKQYRNITIAFLIGLMVGSLYGLWPFRASLTVGDKHYDTTHLLPELNLNLLITVGVFLVGCGIILWFSRFEKETK